MRLRPISKGQSSSSKLRKSCCLLVMAVATVGLPAQVLPAAAEFPSKQQVIAFLAESIDWYGHCEIERQIANDPVDLVFLQNNRPGAAEILQSSFDFARADAQFSAAPAADSQKGSAIAP